MYSIRGDEEIDHHWLKRRGSLTKGLGVRLKTRHMILRGCGSVIEYGFLYKGVDKNLISLLIILRNGSSSDVKDCPLHMRYWSVC